MQAEYVVSSWQSPPPPVPPDPLALAVALPLALAVALAVALPLPLPLPDPPAPAPAPSQDPSTLWPFGLEPYPFTSALISTSLVPREVPRSTVNDGMSKVFVPITGTSISTRGAMTSLP